MLSVSQFSRQLPCSVRHAYVLVERGSGNGGVKAYRFGGRRGIKIPKDEVGRFRDSRLVEDLNHG